MNNKPDATEVLNSLTAILDVLKSSPEVKINKKPQADITTKRDRLKKLVEELVPGAERALTTLLNERDDLAKELNTDRTAGLSVVRGQFGPDSDEYERAGGTRASERKKPARKTTKPA